jgi:hypothetical protein
MKLVKLTLLATTASLQHRRSLAPPRRRCGNAQGGNRTQSNRGRQMDKGTDQQRGRALARPLCFPAPGTRFSGSGLLRSPSRELPLPCRQACLLTRGSVRCTNPRV